MMNSIDLIRWALTMTDAGTARLVEDMREVPLTQPTPGGKGGGGNHPLWVLGHLSLVDGEMAHVLLGEKNPVEHWRPMFGMGTQPTTDGSAYPSFDEVLRTYRDLRTRNLKLLEQIGESGLDKAPRSVPPGFEEMMRTVGQTFLLIALHNMVHYGQIADARRAAGRKPLM